MFQDHLDVGSATEEDVPVEQDTYDPGHPHEVGTRVYACIRMHVHILMHMLLHIHRMYTLLHIHRMYMLLHIHVHVNTFNCIRAYAQAHQDAYQGRDVVCLHAKIEKIYVSQREVNSTYLLNFTCC